MQLNFDYSRAAAFQRLNDYMREIRSQTATGASLCLIQRDAIVHEWYDGHHDDSPGSRRIDADSQFHLASVRKTYLAFAVSVAIEEGRIASVDDFAADYLAGSVDPALLEGTTIRHLLTHTHGLKYTAGGLARVYPPGTGWSYNNAGVNLLIRIVGIAFGRPLAQVIRERVFEPLAFQGTGWRKERSERLVWMGETYEAERGDEANLFASTRELAYWGYVHLTKGRFGDRKLAPDSVFERAVSAATPAGLPDEYPRNGYFWWVQDKPSAVSELGPALPSGSCQSLGAYGCSVLVLPAHEAVAVRMLNQGTPNPPGYDYLADIRGFGDLVNETLEYASMKG